MSALTLFYPGHLVVESFLALAAAVALLTATAWLVSLTLGRYPAIRHWVLLSALLCTLASPLLVGLFAASGTSLIAVPLLAAEESPSAAKGEADDNRPCDATAPIASGSAGQSLDAPAAGDGTSVFRATVVAVLLVWCGGTLTLLVGLTRCGLFWRRLRKSMQPVCTAELGGALEEARQLLGARTSPQVVVSSRARTPMAAGLVDPLIVLPADLLGGVSREQLRDVLMHELAHLERRDNLIVFLQALAKAVFWPIPFVHLVNRQLAQAREDICDNHVLSSRDAVSYGETLLRLAQLACDGAAPLGAVGIFQWRGKLEGRIFGLIHQGRSKMTRLHPLLATGVLGLFTLASALLCGT